MGLQSATVRDVLIQALLDAPMFEVRWRWNATRSLAIQRNRNGKRVPPQFQRMDAEDLPIDFSGGTIHGIWMLGAFDYHTSGGIAWKLSDLTTNLGLEVGSDVEVSVLDNEGHEWSSLGTITITEEGIDGGAATLPTLSTLIVSTPQ